MSINRQLRREVQAKMGRLDEFLADLDRKAVRYRRVAAERHVELPPDDLDD